MTGKSTRDELVARLILVRGIGPGLATYGITSPLNDPMLTLYSGSNAIATNSAWATSSTGQVSLSRKW